MKQLLLAIAMPLLGADCIAIAPQKTAAVKIAPDRPACLDVTTGAEPAQIVVEQTADMEMVTGGRRADAFTFGRETATLEAHAHARVEIRQIDSMPKMASTVAVSVRTMNADDAVLWRTAEETGTAAKRSGTPADLAMAAAAWEKTGDATSLGRARLDQGDAALSKDLAAARGFYEDALSLCASYIRCRAEAANNSGLASQEMGEFEAALARLTQASADFGRLGEKNYEGRALSNIGLLYRQTGDYQRAIQYYHRAMALFGRGDALATARALNNIGVCYQYLAEYEKAETYFARALAAFEQGGDQKDAGRARLNLGRNYLLERRLPLARKALTNALAQAGTLSDNALRGDALNNLGQTLIALADPAEASLRLEEAVEIHRAMGDRRLEALDLHHLGIAAVASGDFERARKLFTDAYQIREAARLRDGAADSLFELAKMEKSSGNAAAARTLAERGLAMVESVRVRVPSGALRASYFAHKRRFLELLVELESGSPEQALLAADRGKGRALIDLLAEGNLTSTLPPDLARRRNDIENELSLVSLRLASAPMARAAALRHRAETLVREEELVDAHVKSLFGGKKLGDPWRSSSELRAALPPDSALIEYFLGSSMSYAWLIRDSGIRMFTLPGRGEIEARCGPLLELFPRLLERKRSAALQLRYERAQSSLSQMLIAPLGRELPPRLILVLDGVLTRVPFAALESSGHRLGLTHQLVQIPSAAYLARGKRPRPISDFPKSIFVVADPVFSAADPRVRSVRAPSPGELARLPFRHELEVISQVVPSSRRALLTGFDATAANVSAAPLGDFAVLHFSTHALIDDRVPDLSRVVLSLADSRGETVDGFLRPAQLARFPLNGSVVVLSACDTALGKQVLGEGLAGFTASLFSAGAAQLVLTVSEADAEGSSIFWAEAYRAMLTSAGSGVEGAVASAARVLAQSARWSDPYYWASFTVHGLPGRP